MVIFTSEEKNFLDDCIDLPVKVYISYCKYYESLAFNIFYTVVVCINMGETLRKEI